MFKSGQKILEKYFVWLFLLAIFIASTYYLWQAGMFYVHDFTIGAKIVEMSNGLKSGQIPIRWSVNLGYGFGMPLFNFYAPLPYFLGAIFYLLSGQLILSIKFLYLLLSLITLLGSFKLGKKMCGFWAGLLLAAAFTLAPYRAVNLFVRGALSEAFAMSFFPWVILAIENLVQEKNKQKITGNLILLFISLLAIILSHNLSALMFIPFAALWAFLRLRKKTLWRTSLTFLLAFLSSAFYSLPSFFEKDLTQVDKIFSGYFDYRLHFLYIRQFFQSRFAYGGSTWGPNDDISFFLGWGQLIALLILSIFFLIKLIKVLRKKSFADFHRENSVQLLFLGLTFSAIAAFLSLEKSHWLWNQVSLLSYIQFPWRFLGILGFFLALSLAIASSYLNKIFKATIVSCLILLTLFNAQFFKAANVLLKPEVYYYADAKRLSAEMSRTLPDYIPSSMAEEDVLQIYNQLYPEPSVWSLEDAATRPLLSSQLLDMRSHKQIWQLNMSEAALLNFKIANFSGWRAKIDQEPVAIVSDPELGNIQLLIPAGEHQVEIYFGENKLRLASDLISLGSLIIFFAWMIILKRKPTNH